MEDESSELLSSSLEQPEGAVVAVSAHEEERSVSLATHFVVVGLDYERPAELEPFWKEAAPPKPETPATLRFLKPGAASAPTVRAGVSYKGRQLHRFPADDVESKTQLPSHLWLFVFPTGVVLETAPQPPCFFVNALTFADGSRSYVTCIKFYEKTPWSVKKSKRASQALGGDDGRIYAPKAICYVSTLPLFAFFKSYLAQLFLNSQPSSTNWNAPLELYVSQVVRPITMRFANELFDKHRLVMFSCGGVELACPVPNLLSDTCITDVSFRYLFQALSVENVILLLTGLLTEQKLLFHSSKYVLLVTIMQSLTDLLLPLRWPHTFILTVPANLLEFVDAPTPFVMGVHSDQMAQLEPHQLEYTIVVDCDRNEVRLPKEHFMPLPADLLSWMRETIDAVCAKYGVSQRSKNFVEAQMETIDLVFATRATGYDGASSDPEFTLELRVAATMLLVRLFGDYHKFRRSAGDGLVIYDEQEFLSTRDIRHRSFVAEITTKVMFEMFVAEPTTSLMALLTRLSMTCSQADAVRHVLQLRNSAPVERLAVAPPKGTLTIWSYNQFPSLAHENYGAADAQVPQPNKAAVEVARLVSALIQEHPADRDVLVLAEVIHSFVRELKAGRETRLGERIVEWFRGVPIEAPTETELARPASGIDRLKEAVGRRVGKGARAGSRSVGPMDAVQTADRESARSAMEIFVRVLGFYVASGDVRFASGSFRELCRVMRAALEECDTQLGELDAAIEHNVVVCWNCGHVNTAMYTSCLGCAEQPLGGVERPAVYVPRSSVEERLFRLIRTVLVHASSIFSSPREFGLAKLGTAKAFDKFELWEWCIFSDYAEKESVALAAIQPLQVPAYPTLFPIAAFYTSAMSALLMPARTVTFLSRLPFEATIRETLTTLTVRLEANRGDRNDQRGVIVTSKQRRGAALSHYESQWDAAARIAESSNKAPTRMGSSFSLPKARTASASKSLTPPARRKSVAGDDDVPSSESSM